MLNKLIIQQVRLCFPLSAATVKLPAIFTHSRLIHVTTKSEEQFATKQIPKNDWNCAISEAERIVGHPTSLLSLRWLLSGNSTNLALHLRKLVGSKHPLLKTAKHLLYYGKNTIEAWGLIILLVSKAAEHGSSVLDLEQGKSAGVLHSQSALVKLTEKIWISHLVHNSLVNLQRTTESGEDIANKEDMIDGNKICLLIGDHFLGHLSIGMADLRDQKIYELLSSCVRDFSDCEFFGDRDEQNNPLPSKPGTDYLRNGSQTKILSDDLSDDDSLIPIDVASAMGQPEKEWEVRNILNAGSLLGKSCHCSVRLAGQSEEMQKFGYQFGKHLALAWQACLDAEPFQSSTLPLDCTFSLISAPVLFHLEWDPSLYDEIEKGKVSVENISYHKVHKAILNGPGLERTKELQHKHTTAAMHFLEKFPPSDARRALENIILAMQDM